MNPYQKFIHVIKLTDNEIIDRFVPRITQWMTEWVMAQKL